MKFPYSENTNNKGKYAKLGPNPLEIEWRARAMTHRIIVSVRERKKNHPIENYIKETCMFLSVDCMKVVKFPLENHNHAGLSKP
jgi:hypothetical protein